MGQIVETLFPPRTTHSKTHQKFFGFDIYLYYTCGLFSNIRIFTVLCFRNIFFSSGFYFPDIFLGHPDFTGHNAAMTTRTERLRLRNSLGAEKFDNLAIN
jgi:hypothetical protein